MSLAINSITLNNIVGPSTAGETVTITFNQSVADASLNGFVSISPSYIASLSGDITSSDGGTTFTGTIVRTLGMNLLSNTITISYGALTANTTFNVLESAGSIGFLSPTQLPTIEGNTNDKLGFSTYFSDNGNILAIGCANANNNSGLVRVFEYDNSNWTQLGADINAEASSDLFGRSVALSNTGTRLAAGGIHNDGNGLRSGHARIFDWNGTAWVQVGADIDGLNAGDWFGMGISLSNDGNTIAISTLKDYIIIFEWNGTAWVQKGSSIVKVGQTVGNGVCLSADGTIVALSVPTSDSNSLTQNGSISIYQWNGTDWVQIGADIVGQANIERLGHDISLSNDGTIIAVSSINTNLVRAYKYENSAWTQYGTDIVTELNSSQFGIAVSISNDGSVIAASSLYYNGTDTGHYRVFKYSGSDWVQQGNTFVGTGSDMLGGEVAISGDGKTVVATSTSGLSNKGYAQIYRFTEGLVRSISSMTMADTNIKFPETGSTFAINFSTNDKTLGEIQGNVFLDPAGAGTLSGLALANNGFQLTGTMTASIEESTGNKLKYIEGALNDEVTFILNTTEKAISNICFYGDAMVLTNNGYKCIADLDANDDKIHGQNIKTVTKTVTQDKYVVLMKAGSIMPNMPIHNTYITKEHKVLFKGSMIEAHKLVNDKTIKFVKYDGSTLYNVLLDGEGKMVVNGMIVETLSPQNNIAILHNMIANYSDEQKKEIIKIFNEERASKKSTNKSLLYA